MKPILPFSVMLSLDGNFSKYLNIPERTKLNGHFRTRLYSSQKRRTLNIYSTKLTNRYCISVSKDSRYSKAYQHSTHCYTIVITIMFE